MKKNILLLLGWSLLPVLMIAQDETVTNAFLDLQRKGHFESGITEMRKSASRTELNRLLDERPACNYFVFTESREYDIVMDDSIPSRWCERKQDSRMLFSGDARPGEFYTFQVGLFTPYQDLNSIRIEFEELRNQTGGRIKKNELQCFNLGGTDVSGKPFRKDLTVLKGNVQPLWIGVNVAGEASGTYKGKIRILPKNAPAQIVDVALHVSGDRLLRHGDDEGWRKGRLRWLNSTIGVSEQPTSPYIPVRRDKNVFFYLGGKITIGPDGLPMDIRTHYNESNSLDEQISNPVLNEGMRLVVETDHGIETFKPTCWKMTKESPAAVEWMTLLRNSRLAITVRGMFCFDGFMHYDCEVKAKKNIHIKDIRMEIPYTKKASTFMMGLGHRGGLRPHDAINWKWNVDRHQDQIWMGDVNCGMNVELMDDKFVRPLVNVYYALGKLRLPMSWGNDNKGGIRIEEKEDCTLLTAYSGERTMTSDEDLHYNFNLLVTPVKPLNLKQEATVRFYHSNSDTSADYIPEAKKAGATAVNVHHKKDIYPFINYPYYDESVKDLQQFADNAHANGLGMRLYYTTRELTVKIPELWALRSLGAEVIHDGPGSDARTPIHQNGPHSWLCRNLKTHFIPAWYNAFNDGKYKGSMDLSVITTPDSRWNNYYLEGLDWMVKNCGLDGIYIDDSALDRQTLQRARRILDADGKERLIDMHSWNHFNDWAGYANSIQLYMELLPYMNRIWMGEGFSADNTWDFWLVEMSGIPFGLMSETLDAQNLMRGMTFGMLPRLPWSGNPVPMWGLWDKFGMKDAEMIGFWDSRNPIVCVDPRIKATVFNNRKNNEMMVVLSNWSGEECSAHFRVQSQKVGWCDFEVSYPVIEGIQNGSEIERLKPNGGCVIMIKKK